MSLYAARGRVGPQLDPRLVELARDASGQVSTRVLRELLGTASHPRTTALFLDAIRRFLSIPLFESMQEAEKIEVLVLLRATVVHPPMTEKLLELMEHPCLHGLRGVVRLRLLTYAVGPASGSCSAPTHARVLMGAWLQRAEQVHELLAMRPGADEIHEFLLARSQPFHLLRTPADIDLLIVAFGPPNVPSTLSYSRGVYADPAGNAEASVVSPSPLIASSWRTRAPIARRLFEMRTTTLTRLEEFEVVRWIEHNHIIGPAPVRTRGQWPFGMFLNALRFAEAMEPIANRIASVRGPLRFHRTVLQRGVPVRGRPEGPRSRPPATKNVTTPGRRAPAAVGGRHG